MFRNRRFHEGRDVDRLLGNFSVVHQEDSTERPPSSHLNVLTSIGGLDYRFFVMERIDSELFGKDCCGARKSKLLCLHQTVGGSNLSPGSIRMQMRLGE